MVAYITHWSQCPYLSSPIILNYSYRCLILKWYHYITCLSKLLSPPTNIFYHGCRPTPSTTTSPRHSSLLSANADQHLTSLSLLPLVISTQHSSFVHLCHSQSKPLVATTPSTPIASAIPQQPLYCPTTSLSPSLTVTYYNHLTYPSSS